MAQLGGNGSSLKRLLSGQPEGTREETFLTHYPHSPHRSEYFTVYRAERNPEKVRELLQGLISNMKMQRAVHPLSEDGKSRLRPEWP